MGLNLNHVPLRDNRRHEHPPFHRSRCSVPNPMLPRLPVHHPRSLTPPRFRYLHPRVDTPTLITHLLRHLLTPLPVQVFGQGQYQHHRGRHLGEYTMSPTRHQIPTMGPITLSLLPLMFRPPRKNGYRGKRKRAPHPHPTNLFHLFLRRRFGASLLARAITTAVWRIKEDPFPTHRALPLTTFPGQPTRFWISRPITLIIPSTEGARRWI